MEASQQKVIDDLNATLKSLEAARSSISTDAVGYERIIARHDELKTEIEELRDSYAKPRHPTPVETVKHPLIAALEAVIPDRPARFDVMRAYDRGVRDAINALQQALDAPTGLPWIRVQDGRLFISRCNFFYPQATENDAGKRDNVRFNLVDRMDGDIILDFNGATLDAEHVARMLAHKPLADKPLK